jgi:Leucine-rich repeat (LRR) protein
MDMVNRFMGASEFECEEKVKNEIVRCLLKNDKSLCLSCLALTDDNIIKSLVPFLIENSQITNLDISANCISDVSVICIAKEFKMKKIKCVRNNIDSESVIALARNEHLTSLDISETSLVNSSERRIEALQALASSTSLKELIIRNEYGKEDAPIDDEGVEILASSKSLIRLTINGNNVSDKGAKAFVGNNIIRYLNIGNNPITDEGVGYLSLNTSLKSLIMKSITLASNNIDDNGIEILSRKKNLQSLDITHNKVTDVGMLSLTNNKDLKSLVVCCNSITDVGAEYLFKKLSLNRLDISNTFITQKSFRLLESSNIEKLVLEPCKLYLDGVRKFVLRG